MSIQKLLEHLLPSREAQWAVCLTIFLLPPAFIAPDFLSPLLPKLTAAEIVLIKILLPTLVALVGSWLILYFVISEFHLKAKEYAFQLEDQKRQSKISLEGLQRFNRPIKYDDRGIV